MNALEKDRINPAHVLLHVYDLGKYMKVVNTVSRAFDWGIFHVGVEVYGKEWCFERTFSPDVPGISAYTPKQHPSHVYRESVLCGETQLSNKQVLNLLRQLRQEWPGTSYHLLRRNCVSFAETLTKSLGVGGVPRWVRKAPEQGLRILEDRLHLETIASIDDHPTIAIERRECDCEEPPDPDDQRPRTCLNWFDSAAIDGPWEDDEGNVWEQSTLPGAGGAFASLRAMPPRNLSDVSSPSSSSKHPCESAESVEPALFPIPERKDMPASPSAEAMELQRPLTEKLKSINRAQRKNEFLTLLFGPPEEGDSHQSSGPSGTSASQSASTRRITPNVSSGSASPNPHRGYPQIGTPSKAPWSGLLGGAGGGSPSTTATAENLTATGSPLTPNITPHLPPGPALGPATIRKLSSASAPVSPGPGAFTIRPNPSGILGRFSCCSRRSPVASSPTVPSPIVKDVHPRTPGDKEEDEPSVGLDALDREVLRSVSFQDDLISYTAMSSDSSSQIDSSNQMESSNAMDLESRKKVEMSDVGFGPRHVPITKVIPIIDGRSSQETEKEKAIDFFRPLPFANGVRLVD